MLPQSNYFSEANKAARRFSPQEHCPPSWKILSSVPFHLILDEEDNDNNNDDDDDDNDYDDDDDDVFSFTIIIIILFLILSEPLKPAGNSRLNRWWMMTGSGPPGVHV